MIMTQFCKLFYVDSRFFIFYFNLDLFFDYNHSGMQQPELQLSTTPLPNEVEPIPAFVATNKTRRDLYRRRRTQSCAPSSAVSAARARLALQKSITTQTGQTFNQNRKQISASTSTTKFNFGKFRKKLTRSLSHEKLVDNMFDDTILMNHHETFNHHEENNQMNNNNNNNNNGDTESGRSTELSFSSRNSMSKLKKMQQRHNMICKYESLDYDQCENMLQLEEDSMANRLVFCFDWLLILIIIFV